MEQGLDGRPRTRGLQEGVGEIVDHLLVAHVPAIQEGQDVVHADAREVLPLDGLEVGAAALHPEDRHLSPAIVALGALDRGVAPAPHHQRRLDPHEPRGIDEEVEVGEAGGRGVAPAGVHWLPTLPDRARPVKPRQAASGTPPGRWLPTVPVPAEVPAAAVAAAAQRVRRAWSQGVRTGARRVEARRDEAGGAERRGLSDRADLAYDRRALGGRMGRARERATGSRRRGPRFTRADAERRGTAMHTFADPLRRAFLTAPDALAVVCGSQRLTYAEIWSRCRRLGGGLRGLGLSPGDRVALLGANCHRYLRSITPCPPPAWSSCP